MYWLLAVSLLGSGAQDANHDAARDLCVVPAMTEAVPTFGAQVNGPPQVAEGLMCIPPKQVAEGLTGIPLKRIAEGCMGIPPKRVAEGCMGIPPKRVAEGCMGIPPKHMA